MKRNMLLVPGLFSVVEGRLWMVGLRAKLLQPHTFLDDVWNLLMAGFASRGAIFGSQTHS